MEHEEIRKAFHEVYNNFYLKYRDKGMAKTDEEWEKIIESANEIICSFHKSDLVRHMVNDLIHEIEISDKKYKNQ